MKKIITLSMMALMMLSATGCSTKNTNENQNDQSGNNTNTGGNTGGIEDEGVNKALRDAIDGAKISLEAFAASELTKASKKDDGTVSAAVLAGKNEIEKATTLATVQSTLELEKTKVLQAINAIKSEQSQPSVDYNNLKETKKTELDGYFKNQIATSGKTDDGTVNKALNDGYNLIDGAINNEDKINEAFENAKVLIDNAIKNLKNQVSEDEKFSYFAGLNESIALEWNETNNGSKAYYKKAGDSDYTEIDNELVRLYSGVARADILGLTPGNYSVKVITSSNKTIVKDNILVSAQDRSGYGHFKASQALGAYENDGSLKKDAIVVYVSDETKNTVTKTINNVEYVGLVNILNAKLKNNQALDIRILKTIKTRHWDSKTHGPGKTNERMQNIENLFKHSTSTEGWNTTVSSNYDRLYQAEILRKGLNTMSVDESAGITDLDNITSFASCEKNGIEYDSYWNEIDVIDKKNITVEGVGYDAGLFQLGFTFKKCSYIEVKNLEFTDYTEDACAFEGVSSEGKTATKVSDFTTGHIWIHNNTFNVGKNRWDICGENDKNEGDGATDIKCLAYQTLSYNHYIQNHKTGLVGGSDTQKTSSITFHHNYYENCKSRLPFVRQANVHMYNNYYYKSTGNNMQIYAGANAFIENCYFDQVNNPMVIKTSDNKLPCAKIFNSIFNNCSGNNEGIKVQSRTAIIDNQCLFGENFDQDSSLFYYDSNAKKSDVTYMTNALKAKEDCVKYAGILGKSASAYPVSGDEVGGSDEPATPAIPNEALQIDGIPTSAGFYARNYNGTNNLDLSETNRAYISNDKINVIDTNNETTTYAYYMFDKTYTTGVVEYELTFSVGAVGGKWNIVQFMDGEANINIKSCGIDNLNSKKIGYSVNSNTEVTMTNDKFTANTDYMVKLTVDYTNNIVKLSIGEYEAIIEGYTPKEIKGVCYQTAKTAIDRTIVSTIPTITVK